MTADPAGPAQEEAPAPLYKRRPAELGTFVAGVVTAAAGIGLDLDPAPILAGFAVLGSAPFVISYFVDLYRDAIRDLGS